MSLVFKMGLGTPVWMKYTLHIIHGNLSKETKWVYVPQSVLLIQIGSLVKQNIGPSQRFQFSSSADPENVHNVVRAL